MAGVVEKRGLLAGRRPVFISDDISHPFDDRVSCRQGLLLEWRYPSPEDACGQTVFSDTHYYILVGTAGNDVIACPLWTGNQDQSKT